MHNPGEENILQVKGLTKSFGDVDAVKDLSLEVKRGEIFGFLGPNGAGKTTTISLICGLLKRDSGEIVLNGIPLDEENRESIRLMGLCPQELIIWESLTCQEQLEFTARMYDISGKISRKRALELMQIFGLAGKRNKLAKTLSGGFKRRLNIALALVHEPQILILDEPQAGLDPQSRVLVREYIKTLAGKVTVILTTHDMDEADRMSDRIAIMDHGQLLVLDTSEKLKKKIGEGEILEIKLAEYQEEDLRRFQHELPLNLQHLSFREGILNMIGDEISVILTTILEKLDQNRLKIEDITIRKKTLEDVFITLTGRGLRE